MRLLSSCEKCHSFRLYTKPLVMVFNGIEVTSGLDGVPKYLCGKCRSDIKEILNVK